MKEKSTFEGRGAKGVANYYLTHTIQNKGITLIALVVTIVVLLILAAITITMVFGDNGILKVAKDSETEHRAGTVEDEVTVWKSGKWLSKYGGTAVQSRDELIEDQKARGLLTETEAQTAKETGSVKIGNKIIDYGNEKLTLGEVYNDDMIGQKITYSSNGQNEWILFGKDKSGNVLITTENPVESEFVVRGTLESWLVYEDELNEECSVYGATIQGREIISRSITLDDVNYVTGFDKIKPEYDTYTFGTEIDYENKQVDCLYPKKGAIATIGDKTYTNWVKASSASEAEPIKNDWYHYGYKCMRILRLSLA